MSKVKIKYNPFYLVFILVLVSRIPFIFAGYGIEEDSWGIALAAYHTHLSHVYEPSRFPGHPVQELIYSALWGGGPVLFNGLSALMSAIGAMYFARFLHHMQFKNYLIGALAFAFIPVVYISSTYTIDFIWTETFVLISLYLLATNRLALAGVFLGLAIGCRITSGALLIPFTYMVWMNGNRKTLLKHIIGFVCLTLIVAGLSYAPLFKQFGINFLMYYDQFAYPPMSKVLYKMIPGVLGTLGVVAALNALPMAITNWKSRSSENLEARSHIKTYTYTILMIVVLYTISYFRLPQKSGYMITVLPFLIWWAAIYLKQKHFIVICSLFILSPFFFSINLTDKLRGAEHSSMAVVFEVSGQELFFDPLTGPIFSDYSKRMQKIKYTKAVLDKTDTIQSKTVIIAGWWYNEIMVTKIGQNENKSITFEPYLGEKEMRAYIAKGYQLFYLPEQNKYNDEMYKISITNDLSKPFSID